MYNINLVKNLKIPFFTIIFIFLGLFLYTKIAGPLPFYIYSVQTSKNDLFTASGEGKAAGIPDIAIVSVGVTQKGLTVSQAQEKINQASKKITDAIRALGIEEKYIDTTNYSVNPEYDYADGRRIAGYTATQDLQIKVKDVAKINKVVDTATAQGANVVGGVNFTFSDELKAKLENKARVMAVQNAKTKANSLAKTAGIKLGRLINVDESSYYPVRAFDSVSMGAGAKMNAEPAAPSNITPGEGTVSITITLSYETY
jgi:uncharacterized protein